MNGFDHDLEDYEAMAAPHVPWRRVLVLFRPHVLAIALIAALIALSAGIGAIMPFLVRNVVDEALPRKDLSLVFTLTGAMMGVAILSAAGNVLQAYVSTRVGQTIMHELRVSLYQHLQTLSLSFYAKSRAGEVQARMSNDIASLQGVLTNTATDLARNISVLITTVLAMFLLEWRLALASMLFMPILIWLNGRVASLREKITFRQQGRMADMTSQVAETLSVGGFLLGRTMGRAKQLVQEFRRLSSDVAHLEVKSHTAGQWELALVFFALDILPALTFMAGGLLLARDIGVSIGTLVALIALQEQLLWPTMELFESRIELARSRAVLARVFGYFDLVPEITEADNPVLLSPETTKGAFEFNNVSFAYDPSLAPAVSNISFRIPAGNHLALVGPSGSGKSTIGYLMARLYDPTRGRILLDGIDLRSISFGSLADAMGIVTQDPFLLNGTIEENLRFAKPSATEAELLYALELAQLTDMLARLSDGIRTEVGERGYQLSGGERQRLSLARVILRNPRILLLDEATSALDVLTEQAMATVLYSGKRRTVLSIAHRLSTVRNADEIIVLEHGQIVEKGPHQQLLASGGRYADMVAANQDPGGSR